jgi:hypothetical protein
MECVKKAKLIFLIYNIMEKYIKSFRTFKLNENMTKKEYYAFRGGKNTNPNPFNIGDIIKQRYRYTSDEDHTLIDGREKFEFVGMKGDMMLMKTLNIEAATSQDTWSEKAVKMNKKLGHNPEIGQIVQLHYMYADRFIVVEN